MCECIIYQLMDIWVVHTFWLLWIMLIWTFMNNFVVMFSVFLGICLGVKSLGHVLSLCLILGGKWQNIPFYIFTSNSSFSTLCQQLLLSTFLIIPIEVGMKWHLFVVLICISFLTNMLNIFLCAYRTLCIFFGEISI